MMCHKIDADVRHYYKVTFEDYAEAQRRTAELSQKMNSIPIVEFVSGVVYPSAEEAAR